MSRAGRAPPRRLGPLRAAPALLAAPAGAGGAAAAAPGAGARRAPWGWGREGGKGRPAAKGGGGGPGLGRRGGGSRGAPRGGRARAGADGGREGPAAAASGPRGPGDSAGPGLRGGCLRVRRPGPGRAGQAGLAAGFIVTVGQGSAGWSYFPRPAVWLSCSFGWGGVRCAAWQERC